MANQYGYPLRAAKEPELWMLFAKVAIGAAGAPTLNALKSKGIKSITRNSAGNYTVLLTDSWAQLMHISVTQTKAAAGLAAPVVQLSSEQVATLAAPQFVLIFTPAAGGVATDPDNGVELNLRIMLKNSSVA